MPPLRDRGTDIELLAQHFLEVLNRQESAAKSFAPATIAALYAHSWPGNVRELKNYVQRAFILADDVIDANLAPAAVAAPESAPLLSVRVGTTLDEVSRRLIEATLSLCRHAQRPWLARVNKRRQNGTRDMPTTRARSRCERSPRVPIG